MTRTSFDLAYLRAMLADHGRPYSKRNPGIVIEPSYFEVLQKRCTRTGHLAGFQELLGARRAAGATGV